MSMLARYKKSNKTMMELVKLVEDSGEPKRTTLIKMIMQEDADFGNKILRRVLDWDKLKLLSEGIIAEVIVACPAKILALALYGEEEKFVTLAVKCLGNKFSDYKSEKETFAETPPNQGQVESARRKAVAEARKLEADGAFKLMDYDKIDDADDSFGGANSSLGTGASAGPAGSANAESGAPAIATFNMEVPPAGLIGERFEEYVKKTLEIK